MNKCAIALGSNLGNSQQTLEDSLTALNNTPGIDLLDVSRIYKTKPVSDIPQPDYLNGCAILNVQQNPRELLTLLQAIELQFGRVRKEKWGARTLDLDILLYEDLIIDTPELKIPHPLMRERAFVLVPLAEIAANWQLPKSGQTIASLAGKINTSGVELV